MNADNYKHHKDQGQRRKVCPNRKQKMFWKQRQIVTDWHPQMGAALLAQLCQNHPDSRLSPILDQTDLGRFLHREVGLKPMISLNRPRKSYGLYGPGPYQYVCCWFPY